MKLRKAREEDCEGVVEKGPKQAIIFCSKILHIFFVMVSSPRELLQ